MLVRAGQAVHQNAFKHMLVLTPQANFQQSARYDIQALASKAIRYS